MDEVLVRPIITEKSMNDASRGKFTFAVTRNANKAVIKKAIEREFMVNVVRIQTAIMSERIRRVITRRGRREVSTRSLKKAIVTLKVGQNIPLFEVGEQKGGNRL